MRCVRPGCRRQAEVVLHLGRVAVVSCLQDALDRAGVAPDARLVLLPRRGGQLSLWPAGRSRTS